MNKSKLTISSEKTAKINPKMIGLFFEDLSNGADGGLHAELIENRSFGHKTPQFEFYTDESGRRKERLIDVKPDPGYGWTSSSAEFSQSDDGFCFARLFGCENGATLTNKGYDGIYLKPDMSYNVTLSADIGKYNGEIIAELVKDGIAVAACVLTGHNGRFTGTVKADNAFHGCEFKLSFPALNEGEYVDVFLLSMMPDDAVLGIFRRDMAEAMREINPGFLRFPGGCVVEGYCLENRYRWKDTVGPIDKRNQNWNRWAFKQPDYNQTFGIGFYEYFLLCEYLECAPVPIINAGMACQYNTSETVPLYDRNGKYTSEFMEYIGDALDLIEFANGDVNSEWGALRAEMGHPEPFNMTLLGIGNEQWETADNHWFERYEAFEKFIHEKYPEINLICSAGPKVGDESYNKAWKWIRKRAEENPKFAAFVDEHNYNTIDWFLNNTEFYDSYDRKIPVYLGEYAVKVYEDRDGERQFNNLISAISEAAFLCGLERNGDVVKMASYAPLFSKKPPRSHWAPNMIWFDEAGLFKTPNFYVQKMFSANMGEHILKSRSESHEFHHTVSIAQNGDLIIKLVNPTPDRTNIQINIDDAIHLSGTGEIYTLASDAPTAANSFENPENIRDEHEPLTGLTNNFTQTLKPYSLTVLRLK